MTLSLPNSSPSSKINEAEMVVIKEYDMDGNKIKVRCKTMAQQFNIYLNSPVNQSPTPSKRCSPRPGNLSKKNTWKES